MVWWKILAVGYKAQRGWKRIPPERRQKLIDEAGKQARRHGPAVARRVGQAVQQVRKSR
jgi:hypothetical protein